MLENHFVLIERIAKKYHRIYYKYLVKACVSEEDLVQEAYYIVYETVKNLKNKNLPLDIPLIIQGLIWHLNNYIRKILFYNKLFISFANLPQNSDFTQEENIDYLNKKKLTYNPQILFILLREHLTEKEFDLLRKRYIENKTFQEIGKDYKISRQAVKEKIDKILNKIRKKLKNYLLFRK